ncbi:MAG TPA: GH1 family beta-glucosidase [Gaiellaceae bacterium]|nr:GH1 family beta-glucosidase [Gaiellaceae bacterium]
MKFPDGFLWGVATSSFQIEGATGVDGREPSIWDGFVGESGDTGDRGTGHYERWREDVDLIASLGVNAYRFSISWPRMRDPRGVAFYDRLIDGLLERGIEPVVTLYHWDLPARLDWRDRSTAEQFAEYATDCYEAFGDRVNWWLTINEPWISGLLGYLLGLHAPGVRDDLRAEATVFHHLLYAHGLAVQSFRASGRDGMIGLAPNLMPHYPATDDPADAEAVRGSEGYVNRWFLDAIFRGAYPEDQAALYEERIGPLDFVRDGDLATIAAPTDFLGVNYYAPRWMRAAPGDTPWPWKVVVPEGVASTGGFTGGVARTEAGTPIWPSGLTDLLVWIRDRYGDVPILITENGAVFSEPLHDERRIAFVREHLEAVHAALERGVDVRGYCHWSLMDNFEWALGYGQRFGLVHVDYDTLERTVKDSGRWYAEVARRGELP